jgi:hypothetical protein
MQRQCDVALESLCVFRSTPLLTNFWVNSGDKRQAESMPADRVTASKDLYSACCGLFVKASQVDSRKKALNVKETASGLHKERPTISRGLLRVDPVRVSAVDGL